MCWYDTHYRNAIALHANNYTRSLYEHLSVLSMVSKTLSIGMVIGTVVTALVIATLFSNETATAQVMQHQQQMQHQPTSGHQ